MRATCTILMALALAGCARQTAQDGAGERARLQDGAVIEIRNANNDSHGRLTIALDPSGGARFTGTLEGLPPGDHGLHVHEVGRCDGPDFVTAGPHFNPTGATHGAPGSGQAHAGDLGNIVVGTDGRVAIDVVARQLTLRGEGANALFDSNGSSLIIHANPDDLKSDPAGNAGARIACGVMTP